MRGMIILVNKIWFAMIVISIAIAFMNGDVDKITGATLDGGKFALELSVNLMVVMGVWLGLMNVAKKSGLMDKISDKMRPVICFLFPDVPKGHPAIGSISANIIANMMGLGNAATPIGIKAMKDMQSLNQQKHTATHSMCMFLVINTSSVQLIPATVIAIRSSAGSANPQDIIGTALAATICSTIAGVAAAKLLHRFDRV